MKEFFKDIFAGFLMILVVSLFAAILFGVAKIIEMFSEKALMYTSCASIVLFFLWLLGQFWKIK